MIAQNGFLRALFAIFLVFTASYSWAERNDQAYCFSSFRGNGEDGLYLAYSRDGLNWTPLNNNRPLLAPKVGEAQLMRDPSIVQGPDGTFHMVWTAGWWERGIGYAHSQDLIEWSEQRYFPVMEHEPEARNTWAPELFYDEATEEFIIVWSTTIRGRFPETAGSSEDELNHRMFYVTTRDFETLSETELFYDQGFNVIDGAIVQRREGDYVLFLKDETLEPPEKNIRVAYAENAAGPYGPASEPIHGDYWAEGPTAILIGETWYVYYDRYREGRYGAVRTQDFETWEDISDLVSFPRGMRHGTAFAIGEDILAGLKALEEDD